MADSEIRAASENNKKAHHKEKGAFLLGFVTFIVLKNKVAFLLYFDKESIWKTNASFV